MIIERDPQKNPRPSTPSRPTPPSSNARLDRLFLDRRGQLQWDEVTAFRGGHRRQGHRLIFWSFMAVLIDGLILLSMTCAFVLAFALLMRSPISHLFNGFSGVSVAKLFASVFAVSSWFYMVTLRVFFGFSVGEWACDLRLGQPTQRLRKQYPLRVILRATITLLTGVALLPLLSLMTGKDWAGRISGLKLISLK